MDIKGDECMTKAQIIEELQSVGETWANKSYGKSYLERYYMCLKRAQEMSTEELLKQVSNKKKGE